MVYATEADLQDYLRRMPPDDAEYLLDLASEDVDDLLVGALYDVDDEGRPTRPQDIKAIKRATCAQAIFLSEGKDPTGAMAGFSSVSVGSVAYTRSSRSDAPGRYSSRAISVLRTAGLLPLCPYSY